MTIKTAQKHSTRFTKTNKLGETYEKKGMKTMVIILYTISYLGIFLQATDIVPGIPDRITVAAIVMGLVAANIIQWKQAIKDREDFRNRFMKQSDIHREEIKAQNHSIVEMVRTNADAIQKLYETIRPR